MAPIAMHARPKAASVVCNSCFSTLRPRRSSRPRAVRCLTTSSSPNYATSASRPPKPLCTPVTTRRIPHLSPSPHSRHCYSTNLAAGSLPTLAQKGLAPLPNRRLISLSGPDAAKFLQGLITNNVDPTRHSPFYSAFLDARGRVLWDVFIWAYPKLAAEEWACYIEVDGDEAESLSKHLKRHKLRSKISIIPIEENELSVWSAWGYEEDQLHDPSLVASLTDPRAPGFGIRCLFQGNQDPSGEKAKPSFPVVDTQQYHIRRYLHGIPEGPEEIQRESALPMECNIDLSSGINFRKGCYVGQELTIRTKHTGVVRKRIVPVQLYHAGDNNPADDTMPEFDPTWTNEVVEPGSDIRELNDEGDIKKGRAAGKFIVGIGNIGLALCRLEMMTSMRISAEGGSWRPGVQFGVQRADGVEGNEKPIRIKAIVPQWFKEREREMWDKGRTRGV